MNVDTTKESPTVLSLCTGYGGIERGLGIAGVEPNVIAHVEIEAYAAANLVAKMEEGRLAPAPIWTDLKTLPVEPFRGRVDILTAGYPCQPFSVAGKRGSKDDPRHLWPYISGIIADIAPRAVFLENVEGHISEGLREVLADLEVLGYRTAWGVFSARAVGGRHNRRRVFILALSPEVSKDYRPTQGDLWGPSLSDSTSKRVQRLWGLWQQEPEVHEGQVLPVCGSEGCRESNWKVEPDVGRVVDGCADRVDRIRLLGNGVVPQVAAQAWRVLGSELAHG